MRVDGRISQRRPLFGEILVSEGRATPEQLEEALVAQAHLKVYVGEVLVKLGHITPEDIRYALDVQEHWDRFHESGD